MNKNFLIYGFIVLLWVASGAAVYVTFFNRPPGSHAAAVERPVAEAAAPPEEKEDKLVAKTGVLDEEGNPIDPKKVNKPYELPDFEFTNQSGKPFGKKDLLGKPWVATFVFTGCSGPCPRITGKMRELQKELKKYDFSLVTFTVDPKNDTPEKLTKYADAYSADLSNWNFLTGDQAKIYNLIQQGFKMPVGEIAEGNIIHVNSFVIVDENGFVQPEHYDAWNNDAEYGKLKKKLIEMCKQRAEEVP